MNLAEIESNPVWDSDLHVLIQVQPMTCVCGKIDPLGLPIFEEVGCQLIQTGVLCEECVKSFDWIQILNAVRDEAA